MAFPIYTVVPFAQPFPLVSFTPVLALPVLVPMPFYSVVPPGLGAIGVSFLGAIFFSLVYCGDPPKPPSYTLRSFMGRYLGSTANYICVADGFEVIKVKCTIRGWSRLPPCSSRNSTCYVDTDCRDTFTVCNTETRTCQCQTGYTNVNGKCRAAVSSRHFEDLNSGCQVDADCRDTFAECITTTRTCQCKMGYMNVNGVCKAELNSGCQGDADCKDTFAECSRGTRTCQCKMGYTNVNGVCKGDLNSGCRVDADCHDTFAECNTVTRICQCKMGYTNVNGVCKADLDSGCRGDADCRDTFAECNLATRTCQCKMGYTNVNGVCKGDLNSVCRVDADCRDTFAECNTVTRTCQCKMGYTNENGVCKAVMLCGNPPDIPGLAMLDFTTGTKVGDTRYYICENRSLTFDPESPASSACSSVTCQSDGTWTTFDFTCNNVGQTITTNLDGSRAGMSGTIVSPNYPGIYRPPDLALYRYSIITPGQSLVFTFNGEFGIDTFSDLSIYCGFDLDTNSASETFIGTMANPGQKVCQTGCANILFFVIPGGSGSRAGFNITWQAIV